jgi:hypothetical protein
MSRPVNYRLTWDGPDALWKTLRPSGPLKKQRVYRWGNAWGFLLHDGTGWLAESRLPVAHATAGDTRYLLEAIECLQDDAPPFLIDDMWEEEVLLMDAIGSMSGNSMSLVGSEDSLTRFFKSHGLLIPPEIQSGFCG